MKIVYLPRNLNLLNLLEKHPPSFRYEVEDFKYLIGTIIRLKIEIKKYLDEGNGFIPLNSQILQTRVRHYNSYLKYLITNGIIERDYYLPGIKSFGYKLHDKYCIEGYVEEHLTLRRLKRKRRDDFVKERRLTREYGYLTKWFNPSLQIDSEGAKKYLLHLMNQEIESGISKIRAMEKYHCRMASVNRIENQIFGLSVDDTSKRFHSNLTNLKSGLRKFITYEGQTLCSIDIKNSQPFISMTLLSSTFYKRDREGFNLYNISRESYNSISSVISNILSIISPFPSIIMLVKSNETQASNDIEHYCTLVDKGRLYDFLNEKYYKETGEKLDLTNADMKGIFKGMFFYSLYADNRMHPENENFLLRQILRQYFPRVYKVFSLIKKHSKRELPVILQLIESEIVINRATRIFAKKYPDIPLFTIHDSIVTLEKYKDMVYDHLKSEFGTTLGVIPSLAIERWVNES